MKKAFGETKEQKQYGFPSEEEIEKVIKRVIKPGYRRINKGLPFGVSESDRTKYDLCKSVVRYTRENNLSEQELRQKLAVNQVKIEYILFCHIDKLTLEELIAYVAKLTGRL